MQSGQAGPVELKIEVSHWSDVGGVRRAARALAQVVGLGEQASEEVGLVASELAGNLVKHAGRGTVLLAPHREGERDGIRLDTIDRGPGIADIDQAMIDGFSTAGSLGYGLGTANRLLDQLTITSGKEGTRVQGIRWRRERVHPAPDCPLSFGVATRSHPGSAVNGDGFVIKKWATSALAAVMDGLGHGAFAHRAAETARRYVESHYDLPLKELFLGTSRACRATRGAVMAMARFDWPPAEFSFASIGNVEARLCGGGAARSFVVRRGVVGGSAPQPVVTRHAWEAGSLLILHTDGMSTRWALEDFPGLLSEPAPGVARRLLQALGKEDDDATVLVVRDCQP